MKENMVGSPVAFIIGHLTIIPILPMDTKAIVRELP